jgi:hypothetical protein
MSISATISRNVITIIKIYLRATCKIHRAISISVYSCQNGSLRPAPPPQPREQRDSKFIFRLNDENEMMTTQMHRTMYLSQYTTVTLWGAGGRG